MASHNVLYRLKIKKTISSKQISSQPPHGSQTRFTGLTLKPQILQDKCNMPPKEQKE